MDMLILGGTSWLGGALARRSLEHGHAVTCLARGEAGAAPEGVRFLGADRWVSSAYDAVGGRDWDVVVDLTWQPALAGSALDALAGRAGHWVFVSSVSAYSDPAGLRGPNDERGALHVPWTGEGEAGLEVYGEAKSACEARCAQVVPAHALTVVRPGLIAGYGDRSDRLGYWVARAALATGPRRAVLVPDMPRRPTQVVDVEDLAGWLLLLAERRTGGAYDAVGDPVRFDSLLDLCAEVAGTGPDWRWAPEGWLEQQGVAQWMGSESLPLWVRGWDGFMDRANTRARAEGLRLRPLRETLEATLVWERELGLDRERRSGLSPQRERELLSRLDEAALPVAPDSPREA